MGGGEKIEKKKTKTSVSFKAQSLSIMGSISPSISSSLPLTVPSAYSSVTEVWLTQ